MKHSRGTAGAVLLAQHLVPLESAEQIMIFMAVGGLASLGWLVCWVMILIKLFEREGTGKGILGIVCGIYTFFWGWQNVSALDQGPGGGKYRTIMLIWTICFAVAVAGNVLSRAVNPGAF